MDRDRGDDDDDDGVASFGDFYTKCATFFSEIDKDIDHMISLGEESFEYAGNKLRIAGSTAKGACSNFIQENLSQLFPNSTPSFLDENGCYNPPVVVTQDDQDHADGHKTMSDSSSTQGDTPDKQTGDDNASVKAIDTESRTVPKGIYRYGVDDLGGAKDMYNKITESEDNKDKENSEEEAECEFEDVYGCDWVIVEKDN